MLVNNIHWNFTFTLFWVGDSILSRYKVKQKQHKLRNIFPANSQIGFKSLTFIDFWDSKISILELHRFWRNQSETYSKVSKNIGDHHQIFQYATIWQLLFAGNTEWNSHMLSINVIEWNFWQKLLGTQGQSSMKTDQHWVKFAPIFQRNICLNFSKV